MLSSGAAELSLLWSLGMQYNPKGLTHAVPGMRGAHGTELLSLLSLLPGFHGSCCSPVCLLPVHKQ